MDDLIRLLDSLDGDSNDPLLAVATVVNTRGSAYRRPGARMLVRQSLRAQGAVSAGCLERDIIANCENFKDTMGGALPLLLTYDGSSSDELIFGLKLGCDGIVQVLVEAADTGSPFVRKSGRLQRLLPKLLNEHARLVAVTLFELSAAHDVTLASFGTGLCMLETGTHTYGLDALPQIVQDALRRAAQDLLLGKNPRSFVLQKTVGDYSVSALIEVVEPTTSLLIFGGGQDVQPLVEMADILGWRTNVIDNKSFASRSEKSLSAHVAAQQVSAAVVMTHDYELDRQILQQLINTELPYIGVVGPRRRADKLLAELALEGQPITDAELGRLYSPVGLDLGAERPEEIALSILAEIKAVLAGHHGGMLRHKQGAIHQPLDAVSIIADEEPVTDLAVVSNIVRLNLNANCKLENT